MTTYRRRSLDRLTRTALGTAGIAPVFLALFERALGLAAPGIGLGFVGIAAYLLVVRGLLLRVEVADGAVRVRRDGLWSTRWDVRDVARARLWSVRGPDRGERWRLPAMGAVELTLRGGRTVRVGSEEPARLLAAVQAAAPEVVVDPEVATGPERGPLHEAAYRDLPMVLESAVMGGVLGALASVAWRTWA